MFRVHVGLFRLLLIRRGKISKVLGVIRVWDGIKWEFNRKNKILDEYGDNKPLTLRDTGTTSLSKGK